MSGSVVPFSTTPANWRVPLTTIEIGQPTAPSGETQRALLIGYTQNAQPAAPILITSLSMAQSAFGAGSMLARMVAQYLANDPAGELWALPIPVPAGNVDQTWTLSVGGAATGSGTPALYAGGLQNAAAVASGATPGAVVTALAAAISSNPISSVSATTGGTASAATLVLTAYRYAQAGSQIDLRMNLGGALAGESIPPGLTFSIASTTAGAGLPDLSSVASVLGTRTYDFIACGFSDATSLNAIQAVLNEQSGRWSPISMLYGHVWTATKTTVATIAGTIAATTSENDHHTTIIASNSPTPPWEVAAATMATCAPSLRILASRPLQTLGIQGVVAPPPSEQFTRTQMQLLLTNAAAVIRWDAGGNASVVRMVTTSITDAYGNPTIAWLDTETAYTAVAFARAIRDGVARKFARVGLADNGTHFGAGVPIVTPNDIRNEIIAIYAGLETQGLVEDTEAFAAALIVARNANDPSRVDVELDPTFVSGLRLLAGLVQFALAAQTAAAA